MDSKGYYKSLGINENASDTEIKKAYRKLSLLYHPDKQANKSDEERKEAEDKFKEINEAYQVLSDPEKRQNYDRFGSADGGGFGGNGPFGGGNPFDDFFNGNPFRDFFGGGNRQPRQEVVNGTDIRMTIPLTIEEVFNGCKKKLKYTKKVVCKTCHGDGGSGKHMCPHCNGTGMLDETKRTSFGLYRTTRPCHYCDGTGYVVDYKCQTCGGDGFVNKETIIEVDIPAGMPEGYAIIKDREGNETKDKQGMNGSFYAIAKYAFDKSKYQVNGLDVIETIYIPYYDRYLGCDYIVNIPDGSKKKISIPANLIEGATLKLKKCGIKGTGSDLIGDYFVEVHTENPVVGEMSDKEKELLNEIKKLH